MIYIYEKKELEEQRFYFRRAHSMSHGEAEVSIDDGAYVVSIPFDVTDIYQDQDDTGVLYGCTTRLYGLQEYVHNYILANHIPVVKVECIYRHPDYEPTEQSDQSDLVCTVERMVLYSDMYQSESANDFYLRHALLSSPVQFFDPNDDETLLTAQAYISAGETNMQSLRNVFASWRVIYREDGESKLVTLAATVTAGEVNVFNFAPDDVGIAIDDIVSVQLQINSMQRTNTLFSRVVTWYPLRQTGVQAFDFVNTFGLRERICVSGGIEVTPSTESELGIIQSTLVQYDIEHKKEYALTTPPIMPQQIPAAEQLCRSADVQWVTNDWMPIIITDYELKTYTKPNTPTVMTLKWRAKDIIRN